MDVWLPVFEESILFVKIRLLLKYWILKFEERGCFAEGHKSRRFEAKREKNDDFERFLEKFQRKGLFQLGFWLFDQIWLMFFWLKQLFSSLFHTWKFILKKSPRNYFWTKDLPELRELYWNLSAKYLLSLNLECFKIFRHSKSYVTSSNPNKCKIFIISKLRMF